MKELTIGTNEAGQRLDKFLRKYLKEAGSGFLYKMLRKKNITLNGAKADGSEKLENGDRVCFFLSDETLDKFRGPIPAGGQERKTGAFTGTSEKKGTKTFPQVPVIYENEHILLLDKPAGLLTQKAVPEDYSLNEWLIDYLLRQGQITQEGLRTFRPSVCYRLDRNTSGLVICGKTLAGSQKMSELLRERTVHKYYRLFAAGRVELDGITDAWLSKDEKNNQVKILPAAPADSSKAFHIITGCHPLACYKGYTYLEVELFTGKSHQIRAHMAALGHPLIGDGKYGDKQINGRFRKQGIRSQMLHAYRIEFPEMDGCFAGLSGRSFTAPEPEAFLRLKKQDTKEMRRETWQLGIQED